MLKTIIGKELKRIFSDRRLIFSTFLLPALSIFLIYNLMGILANNKLKDIQAHKSSVVAVMAPDLFQAFYKTYENKDDYEITYQDRLSQEMRDKVMAGDLDAIIEFPVDFTQGVKAYQSQASPDIHIYFNPTEDYSRAASMTLKSALLKDFENHILQDRFGDLRAVMAFTTNAGLKAQDYEIKNEKKASSFGLAQLLPMMLSIMLFASAMGIGMETIAGEKERGTMGALLLTPVSRNTIALGKMIALGILAIISTLASVIALIASLPKLMAISGGELSGQLSYGPSEYLQILVVLLLEVGIFVGLICLISVLSKSMKEAGTYMAPAYMVVMMGAFGAMLSSGKTAAYMYAIPLIGNIFALKSSLNFELTTPNFLITIGVSLLVIGLLVLATAKAFKSEKIMYNA